MSFRLLAAAAAALILSACATPPQAPISLADVRISSPARIGVAMTALPKVDTSFPGAGCLLCMAAASVANSSLTSHARTLPYEDLPQLKQQIAERLRKKNAHVVIINEPIDLSALSSVSSPGVGMSRKDFSSFAGKYQIDKLVVIDIRTLGFVRTYSAYIPTAEPKGVFEGTGYLVNLKNHHYEWYVPVNIMRSAGGKWDEPPKFPGLTNAYFQALESGKDSFLKPFGN
ncbi:MAG TPA: hypothetical protein VED01_18400 [Burkholderiales bacterium]|nr:hypothetical protein [Burkholderiales bacterium]